ncbi:MAG: c-type cytochrome, partial [Planctomycetales bacterium]|nr:c-type cytochrome [Planctomycetales bacterium]
MPESETQLATPRRMPHFAFTADEANDVANYLLSAEPVDLRIPAAEDANAKPSPKANNKNQPADEPPSGERLFLTLGCLACHPHGQAGSASLFGGNSLTHAGDKRPADYFAKWLAEPASLNAQHRMPVFDLSAAERTALAEWLAKQTRGRVDQSGEPSNADAPPANRDASVEASIERGRKLTLDSGCQACHQMPTGEKDNVAPSTPRLGKLSTDSRWERACSAADFDAARPAARRQPIYQLADADRAALRHYFAQRLDLTAEPSQSQAGRQLFVELNCVQCHARGADPGLAESLPELVKLHGELESWLPAMTPPSLNSVGDKLRDEALIAAVRREKNHRPYLLARMPRFPLNKTQLAQLVDYFVAEDRIPDTGDLPPNVVVQSNPAAELDDAVTRVAGARLVTPDGFGCTSCHRVGKVEPPPGPLAARGPTLSMLGQRIRRPWYDRWVRNPARIVPRMEMPSVQLPVHGVLNDDLPTQLAAVWQVLNQPGFEPPAPNALRVARRSGVRDRGEPALLLTDVLRVGETRQLKPALIGLPNRHNVLIDLEAGRMVDWWIGDAARQRTEGKTWFWEVGGTSIGALQPAEHELSLRDAAGRRWQPIQVGQFVTELDDWQHQPDGGIAFSHRMTFSPEPDSESTVTLLVRQTISPIWSDSAGASQSQLDSDSAGASFS